MSGSIPPPPSFLPYRAEQPPPCRHLPRVLRPSNQEPPGSSAAPGPTPSLPFLNVPAAVRRQVAFQRRLTSAQRLRPGRQETRWSQVPTPNVFVPGKMWDAADPAHGPQGSGSPLLYDKRPQSLFRMSSPNFPRRLLIHMVTFPRCLGAEGHGRQPLRLLSRLG